MYALLAVASTSITEGAGHPNCLSKAYQSGVSLEYRIDEAIQIQYVLARVVPISKFWLRVCETIYTLAGIVQALLLQCDLAVEAGTWRNIVLLMLCQPCRFLSYYQTERHVGGGD